MREEDVTKAQEIQAKLLGKILIGDPTDPKLTHSGKKRAFPGIRGFSDRKQVLE